ncbi:Crp/Fnr family transcriptional regulator [Roseivirga sp. E12]|uniref:Crp/Fnr family transcriptional regulator n=1 Tax=Roseivirga sp. E12 TaxID=2819237 RepID=UPI001ABC8045|nr:cyclic nucleotide-binding domain-containing protein [Roseivirga sp. E12]MBO3697737.1 cyclic nucleotide-binding domain-containing protein [Roseivirga sp. E12]
MNIKFDMYQELEQNIKRHGSIGEKELQQIIKLFKPIKTARNEMLCNIGQVCKHFYYIRKGCLRLYEIDAKGNEVTGYFALEDSIISANTSFILQKPSRDCLVSLEPSELLVIHREDFLKLVDTIPQFANVYHKFMEFAFIHSQMRIYSFLGMEGIDKLKWVMEHEPKLLSRISSKAVASYLGMTNSTLSKLRAKL